LNHEVTAITQQPDRVELIANDTPVNIAATFTPAKGNWTTE
jgi:hypothetical protein